MAKGAGTTRNSSAASPNGVGTQAMAATRGGYQPLSEFYDTYDKEFDSYKLLDNYYHGLEIIKKQEGYLADYEKKAISGNIMKRAENKIYAENTRKTIQSVKNDNKDILHILGKRGVTEDIIKEHGGKYRYDAQEKSFNKKILKKYGVDLSKKS